MTRRQNIPARPPSRELVALVGTDGGAGVIEAATRTVVDLMARGSLTASQAQSLMGSPADHHLRRMRRPFFMTLIKLLSVTVLDFFKAGTREKSEPTLDELQAEAEEWLFSADDEGSILSAQNVCDYLGLDRRTLVRRLTAERSRYTARQLASARVREIIRKKYGFRKLARSASSSVGPRHTATPVVSKKRKKGKAKKE